MDHTAYEENHVRHGAAQPHRPPPIAKAGIMAQATGDEAAWKGLYRAGGWAGLLAAVVFRRNISAELLLFGALGVPGLPTRAPVDAAGWFALLESSRMLGLALLDVFDLVNYALIALLILALAVTLRRDGAGVAVVGAACGVGGSLVYFASNRAFELLALGDRYAAASAKGRSAFLAAGEALLASSSGTGVHAALLFATLAGLILSAVMLRGDTFNRATAIVGLIAHAVLLGVFPVLALAPALLAVPHSLAAPFVVAWQVMAGLRLLRLGRV